MSDPAKVEGVNYADLSLYVFQGSELVLTCSDDAHDITVRLDLEGVRKLRGILAAMELEMQAYDRKMRGGGDA